jgi:hypothetical protein
MSTLRLGHDFRSTVELHLELLYLGGMKRHCCW